MAVSPWRWPFEQLSVCHKNQEATNVPRENPCFFLENHPNLGFSTRNLREKQQIFPAGRYSDHLSRPPRNHGAFVDGMKSPIFGTIISYRGMGLYNIVYFLPSLELLKQSNQVELELSKTLCLITVFKQQKSAEIDLCWLDPALEVSQICWLKLNSCWLNPKLFFHPPLG